MKKNVLPFPIILVISVIGFCNTNSNGSDRKNCSSHIIITDPGSDSTGNVSYNGYNYKTIKIGTQRWFAENLQTTQYNDGTVISNVTDNKAWAALKTGAYCWYDNDASSYRNLYGALYNWYAVNTGKLCPSGWHVPFDAEWKTLELSLGMTQTQADGTGYRGTDQGTQMKTTSGWFSNGNGTNTSGISGLPGGNRYYNGSFVSIGNYGNWWSSTEYSTTNAWTRHLHYYLANVYRFYNYKVHGFSVRCLRDN